MLNRWSPWLISIPLACTALALASTLVLLWKVADCYPDNHIGADPRAFSRFALLAALLSACVAIRRKGRILACCCVALALACAWTDWHLDRSNTLVQYDEWLHRGMPKSPLSK